MAKRTSTDDKLGTFEGRPIVEVSVVLRKTGDGLSEPMKIDPTRIDVGDEGYLVLSWRCVDVHHAAEFRNEPATGGVRRVQVLDAGTTTFIDDDVVRRAIADQELLIERWREEQAGVSRLDGTDLAGDHVLGEHTTAGRAGGRVEGCPKCDEEVALEEAGE